MQKEEVLNRIFTLVGKFAQCNQEQAAPANDLRDYYGIDSIVLVELLVAVEECFGIMIDSTMINYDSFSTPQALCDYTYTALQAQEREKEYA